MHTRILVKRGEVSPSFAADDRILLGEGLFETLRVESSKPCFSYLHWQRIMHSAKKIGIFFDLPFEDWSEHLIQHIKQDNLFDGGIKVILSGGSAPRGLVEQGQVSQLILQTFNYTRHTQPLCLVSASWLRDAANPIYQVKSVNYLEAIIARRQAIACGRDDALFFNFQHHATETTCANLFIIKNNELITPSLQDGVLPGITRARVLSLSAEQKIRCMEQSLTRAMIEEADLVFVTNSLQGIRCVRSLDNFNFELSTHPLVEQLIALLAQQQ